MWWPKFTEYIEDHRYVMKAVTVAKTILNAVALVRKQTIPAERPPHVGEVVPNLLVEGVSWSAQRIPTAVNLNFLDPEPLLFHSSSS
jgi:hypothetical protein